MRIVVLMLVVDGYVFGSNGLGGGGNYFVVVKLGLEVEEVYCICIFVNYVLMFIVYEGWLFVFNDKGIVLCLEFVMGEMIWCERFIDVFFGFFVCV